MGTTPEDRQRREDRIAPGTAVLKKEEFVSKKRLAVLIVSCLVIIVVIVGLIFFLKPQASSTASDTQPQTSQTQSADVSSIAESDISVTVALKASVEGKTLDSNFAVSVKAGSSVYDALVATGLALDAQDSSYGKFVNSIDGLAGTSDSAWVYTVNDEEVEVSCDTFVLSDGDRVTWEYISF